MSLAAEILVAALLVLGGAFILIGSWGLARLPSLMTRLHGPTKATTLGVGACLIASMVYFPTFTQTWSAHELLITIFLLLTAPISANMIAKAHLHRQGHGIDPNPADGIVEGLPAPPGGGDWATFQGGPDEPAAPSPTRRD
ncbi:MAG: Na+/H+ antiporter subunit G [Brevundimonas sp.]|uniref:Na+/H+ antiporter subunit G n=1 Tax=Brevundimonas sp. TaxID=1871086 RepID=UPI0027181D3F|nr:Na+/H+ antiporter subunit G [Brevundimonas sp.]MDO9587131.1 Na+/H+ antiporter subunit G [Brevundimonas sp.]MDP3368529.1 Na+/H+ antiporter subunit G [Brevundimonas sp.]MDP3657222.1 Na+/H+ antiporter subunit G [Brevundimonas sp.]MDZ4111291.1 Na+/H+ antiporter subunit G [Brevundimonas sp.]